MFILRRLDSDRVQTDTWLGVWYSLFLKDESINQFNEVVKLWNSNDLKDVYGVVTFNDGDEIVPLYSDSRYYVMTSDGKTFANVSLK